jgi:hypothetical protein
MGWQPYAIKGRVLRALEDFQGGSNAAQVQSGTRIIAFASLHIKDRRSWEIYFLSPVDAPLSVPILSLTHLHTLVRCAMRTCQNINFTLNAPASPIDFPISA